MAVKKGTAAAEKLNGTTGRDTLDGAGGNDTLTGGAGADHLIGGAGNDFYVISGPNPGSDTIREAAGGGTDTVLASITYLLTAAGLGQVENLTLTGGNNINGTGNGLANVITGNNGHNSLVGGAGNDTLNGDAGNDTLRGDAGSDVLKGGAGNDRYVVDAGDSVTETANAGADLVTSATVDWSLGLNVENLTFTGGLDLDGSGNALGNTMTGNNGANVLNGRGGNDALNGGVGDDLLYGQAGNDILAGGAGDDALLGGAGNDVLDGGGGADDLLGGTGNDRIIVADWDFAGVAGGSGEDTLAAAAGMDIDLTASGDTRIIGIDVIDLGGLSTLTLDTLVINLSDDSRLRVEGEATDTLHPGDGWTWDGSFSRGGGDFVRYSQGPAMLEVDADIDHGLVTGAIPLSSLNGLTGFEINGEAADDYSGFSVSSAGDVNGDGYADLLIGAFGRGAPGDYAGASYVVFGKSGGYTANLELSALNGTNGFEIGGEGTDDLSGKSVSGAGDVNGDGYADLLIGAPSRDVNANGAGASYVVFGNSSGYTASFNLSALDGTNGFEINGEAMLDQSGDFVSAAGDVNGDGYADLLIGAYGRNAPGDYTGATYVVFGKSSGFTANLNLAALDGTNGFEIKGEALVDFSGECVSGAGDVNGDGYADLLIGARGRDTNGDAAGASYVVFGKSGGFTADLALAALDGTNGFEINGEAATDLSGISVSGAGDVNGDGYSDLLIGARGRDINGSAAGASYVVFGKSGGFTANLDLSALDGANGFEINGEAAGDNSGASVSGAGDVNGDGYADLLIGAYGRDINGDAAGASYVVFGKSGGFTANLDLSALNGTNGFTLNGEAASDNAGRAVSAAGDVNGDGYADLLVGAYHRNADAGASYVIFGRDFTGAVTHSGTAAADILTGGAGADNMLGGAGADVIMGGVNADRLVGGTGDDTLNGGTGADRLEGGDGADSFIFDTAPAADEILDFESGTDHIVLDRSIFTSFSAQGTVILESVQVALRADITAGSGNNVDGFPDYLKYATDTGELFYDVDGTGAGGLQLIAIVKSGGMMGQSPAVFQFHPVTDIIIVD